MSAKNQQVDMYITLVKRKYETVLWNVFHYAADTLLECFYSWKNMMFQNTKRVLWGFFHKEIL